MDSSRETVAILYDIENAPFEMLNYTLGKARRYQPCRTIVVSDWEERPEQKRWDKLLNRPGFTFRQINRTYLGKNSLDSALYDSAKILYEDGVRRYFIITTDSDFVRIAEMLNEKEKSYIIGIGTKQASELLRNAYDEFFVYPPEEKKKVRNSRKKTEKKEENAQTGDTAAVQNANENQETKAEQQKRKATPKKLTRGEKTPRRPAKKNAPQKAQSPAQKPQNVAPGKSSAAETKTAKPEKTQQPVKHPLKKEEKPKENAVEKKAEAQENVLSVHLPMSLLRTIEARQKAEGVSMNEFVTFLLTRGLMG
ncbi:MAG: NYN domain-containing protein [Selenomonadaceae bacterium]|nr:NYN domain-containing protein [Selenomonadaceae bacterium]MDY2685691.1 NYN domain-containing protein [Selenomonadaceae bacterium]